MESIFVWIVMFAGLAVALLGMFLVASERELKVKKREIEVLLDKLENTPQLSAPTQSIQSDAELADLRAQNRDLQNQLAALSDELEQERDAVKELHASQRMDAGSQIEKQELSAAHERLSREVNELRSRLAASEAQVQSAAEQHHEQGNPRMQAEIADLRRAISERDAKLGELESARQNLPDVNAIEAAHRQEREILQQRITELERQSAMNVEKLNELKTLRDRLAEAESTHTALRDEIRRHDEEVPKWQARIGAAEESRQRLAALQAPCNELLSKQAALADRQRQLQEELVAFARLIAAAADGTQHTPGHASSDESQEPNASAQGSATGPGFSNVRGSEAAPEMRVTQEPGPESTGNPVPGETVGRRFGLVGILLLLAAGGALGFQLFTSDFGRSSSRTEATANTLAYTQASAPAMAAKAQQPSLNNPSAPSPARTEAPPIKHVIRETGGAAIAGDRPAKAEPASLGAYQVVRSSRVYAAPSELSRSIGEIEPGVNVNVVNSRDGWLEIHSKHGRPPGFIRRDVAAKITAQN